MLYFSFLWIKFVIWQLYTLMWCVLKIPSSSLFYIFSTSSAPLHHHVHESLLCFVTQCVWPECDHEHWIIHWSFLGTLVTNLVAGWLGSVTLNINWGIRSKKSRCIVAKLENIRECSLRHCHPLVYFCEGSWNWQCLWDNDESGFS